MAHRLIGTLVTVLLIAPQSQAQSPAFEVASIKPTAKAKSTPGGEGSARYRIEHSPNSLTMRRVSLRDCVLWAYQVEEFQLSMPDSLSAKDYDILAKAAAPVPVSQLRRMLQQLLADRFKLTLHRDTKTIPIYALTVAKGGPKLPPVKTGGDDHHVVQQLPLVENGSFVFPDTTLADFAAKLSLLRGMDRPVLDRTGIDGYFDITLKSAAAALLQENGPSLFTLLQEQLGLKLVPTKTAFEILVVDHAESPTEN
jgi:uncharacterized protein (TIGR03435 family)